MAPAKIHDDNEDGISCVSEEERRRKHMNRRYYVDRESAENGELIPENGSSVRIMAATLARILKLQNFKNAEDLIPTIVQYTKIMLRQMNN